MSSKFIFYRKKNALDKLKNDGWERCFVNDFNNLNENSQKFIHVKVFRKDRTNNLLVTEVSDADEDISRDKFFLELENGFSSKDVISKILVDMELIIKGFTVEQPDGEVATVRVTDDSNASIWALRNGEPEEETPSVASPDNIQVYEYTTLKNLSVGDKLNVFAVVKKISEIKSDSSKNHRLKLYLVDDTVGFDEPVEFTLDTGDPNDLTKIEMFDIVRFHRARFEHAYMQEPNVYRGYGKIGVTGFHFLSFNGEVGSSLTPRKSSCTFSLAQEDLDRVQQLRNWADSYITSEDDHRIYLPLSSFKFGSYQNLFVQVIGVGETTGVYNPIVLRVWDGTKLKLSPLNKLNDFVKEVGKLIDFDESLNNVVEQLDLLVDLFIYDEHREIASTVKSGDFVKLVNVHAYQKAVFVNNNKQQQQNDNNANKINLVLHGSEYSTAGKRYGRGIFFAKSKERLCIQLKSKLSRIVEAHLAQINNNSSSNANASPSSNVLPSSPNSSDTTGSFVTARTQPDEQLSHNGNDINDDFLNDTMDSSQEEPVVRRVVRGRASANISCQTGYDD